MTMSLTTLAAALVKHPEREQASNMRKALILLLVLVKIAYIAWYYVSGIGLNLGDTAQYVDAASAAEFLSRSGGGIGFAYIATLIFSNSVIRIVVELSTVLVLVALMRKLPSDGTAAIAVLVLLLPTNLAFMTVASKEVLVFLVLLVAMSAQAKFALPAYALLALLKPTFVLAGIIPYARRAAGLTLYFAFTVVAMGFVLAYVRIEKFYTTSFYSYWRHFRDGGLSYGDEGIFPIAPVLRTIGLSDLSGSLAGVAISASLVTCHAILMAVLVKIHGGPRGLLTYLVVLSAIVPYSIFNLGSAARYQAPLICAVLMIELIRSPRPE